MTDLKHFNAHICKTACASLIHDNKVLLVQHKKLNIWLAPGGHIEQGELAFETAERECFEETGIMVKAISPFLIINSEMSQYVPVPIISNLHWVSKSNYLDRMNSKNPKKLHTTKLWPRGCEQHFGEVYLVSPIGSLDTTYDPNESTNIGWFSKEDLKNLDTLADIKQEMLIAMTVHETLTHL